MRYNVKTINIFSIYAKNLPEVGQETCEIIMAASTASLLGSTLPLQIYVALNRQYNVEMFRCTFTYTLSVYCR